MYNNSKVGLIIQGPLISKGRSGSTIVKKFTQLTNKDIINYNCIPNIIDIYLKYNQEFDDFVCVTWDTEDTSELEYKIGKKAIMSIKDTTSHIDSLGTLLPGNNKYRQFLSTLKGLERLSKNKCKYAIKIRSDINLDLLKVKKYLLNILENKNYTHSILVPGGNLSSPDNVEDFYFASRTDVMIDACKIMLDKPELYRSIHLDFFYKCAWFLLNKENYWPPNISYTSAGKYSKEQQLIVRLAWSKIFKSFPREIYENLLYRGDKWNSSYDHNLFYSDLKPEDLEDLILDKIKINPFKSIYLKIKKLIS